MTTQMLKVGDIVEGRITGIQPYGIFVRLNDECSGLIHETELDKSETENPRRFFKIGQPLKVRILRIKPGGKQAVLRLQRDAASRRRMGASSFETASGFMNLEKQLEIWVKETKVKQS